MHRIDFNKQRSIPSVAPDDFRQALRQFATGVTIVTAENASELYGITVSAFSSISLDPPIVMVSINNASQLAQHIVDSEHYAVNILGRDAADISMRFAEMLSGEQKYQDLKIARGPSGAPHIVGTLAVLDCALDQTLVVGTHTLMFGRVLWAESNVNAGDPLIYYHRSYCHIDTRPEEPSSTVS